MSADVLRDCECGCGYPAPIARSSDSSRGYVRGESIRFIKGHNAKFWMGTASAEERFWAKVNKTATCWLWTASLNRNGYGRFSVTRRKSVGAHRFAYESTNGPISEDLVLDHLCRVRHCVRPDHLEPVTTTENIRRSKPSIVLNICKRGHEFTPENTRVTKVGYRQCRTCSRMRNRGEI